MIYYVLPIVSLLISCAALTLTILTVLNERHGRAHAAAWLLPRRWRRAHRVFARVLGYFWLPCPLCGTPFGGHEWRDIDGMISATPKPGGGHTAICPTCTRAGRGDRLPYISFAAELDSTRTNQGE